MLSVCRGSVSWSGCPSFCLSVCVSAVAVMLPNAAALLNLTTTPTGHCSRFRCPNNTWVSSFPDNTSLQMYSMSVIFVSWQLQKLESDFDKMWPLLKSRDIFVIGIKPQEKQCWRQFASEGARTGDNYKGRTKSINPRDGCSNKSCVLVEKNKKQWVFFLASTGLQDNWTRVKEKHSQPLRILQKSVDDFFVHLKGFQSECQKYNFHLFWLHRGMLLALNEGCFSVVTLFSASLCLCGFKAEVGPGLIPSRNCIQISPSLAL